jgi:glycine cleavage system H protein
LAPEKINQDAYEAWLFKLKPVNAADLNQLMDAAAYQKMLESEDH